ncbi:MAG: hypothetical protein GY759_21025, partial [Chloroflexi bacterium]|nr:hypothetical protein [Chloroflexota bacterium]
MLRAKNKDGCRVHQYTLVSADYRALLHEYLIKRLDIPYNADTSESHALREAVIDASAGRFAFVSFMVDRIEQGHLSEDHIRKLAVSAERETQSEALYRHWLDGLAALYGRKRADALRRVLAALAAIEQAHSWIHGEGRQADPANGSALTSLEETFQGLSLISLASLLDMDRPQANTVYDRIDPGLHLLLETLQGVLWISRADRGVSRFRLALKAFLPVAQEKLGAQMQLAHARLVHRVMEQAQTMIESDDLPVLSDDRWRVLGELAPFGVASVALSQAQTAERCWDVTPLLQLYYNRDDALEARGLSLDRVSGLTQIIAWRAPVHDQRLQALEPLAKNALAGSLQNRGIAKGDNGDLSGAITDYDAAIKLYQAIRDAQGSAWSIPYQNDLAGSLQNRGLAKGDNGDLSGAITDYDA